MILSSFLSMTPVLTIPAPCLSAWQQRDPRVRLLSHAANRGQHQAVMTGLAAAQGEWSVIMDADLQDPPEALPALLNKGRVGYGAVFAGRRGRYESAGRLLTSRLIKWTMRQLTGLPSDAGIFVAINRELRTNCSPWPRPGRRSWP